MIKEAVILAGGLGTRLRSVVAGVPKCMAPVNGIPFIHFIVAHLKIEGIEKFIFSLGYKNEIITGYLDKTFAGTDKKYVIERELLGTGGAIKKATGSAESDHVIVVNGDTLFNIDISRLSAFHENKQSDCTLALKEMTDFNRYGAVETLADGSIKAFHEKKFCDKGTINGGVYALNIPAFLKEDPPDVFSFEKWMEENTATKKLYGEVFENYFIDIGIPEDYQRFSDDYNLLLANQSDKNPDSKITASFLDNFFELLN